MIGCGPIGLAALAALVDRGLHSVIAIDPGGTRRDIAMRLGAEAALDPEDRPWSRIRELHGTHPRWPGSTLTTGFVEASGSAAMVGQVITRAAPRARISVPALHAGDVPVNLLMVMMKELEIRGAMEYPERFADALDLLRRATPHDPVLYRPPPRSRARKVAKSIRQRYFGR